MKEGLLILNNLNHPIIIDSSGQIYDTNEQWRHVGYIYAPYVPLQISTLKIFESVKETNENGHTDNFLFTRIKNKIARIFSRNLVSKLFGFAKR